jgi:hypothetical protein
LENNNKLYDLFLMVLNNTAANMWKLFLLQNQLNVDSRLHFVREAYKRHDNDMTSTIYRPVKKGKVVPVLN